MVSVVLVVWSVQNDKGPLPEQPLPALRLFGDTIPRFGARALLDHNL